MHSQTHLPWLNKPLGQMTISQTYAWPWTKRLPPGGFVDDGAVVRMAMAATTMADAAVAVEGRRRLDFILFLYGTIGSANQQPC
jgi:hypothetical protein